MRGPRGHLLAGGARAVDRHPPVHRLWAGRDNGLTASPTRNGGRGSRREQFEIAFGGRTQLQFAPDSARVFIAAARAATEGARAFNLGGPASTIADAAGAIEAAAPGVTITVDEQNILPFPEEFDGAPLEEAIGPIAWTPLAEASSRRSTGCEPRGAERRIDEQEQRGGSDEHPQHRVEPA